MNQIIKKDITIKAAEGRGIIEGYASTFGNIDRHGDIIKAGAFKDGRAKVPIFALHDPSKAIGVGYVQEDQKGLKITMQLAVDDENSEELQKRARDYYAQVKAGIIEKMSVGMIIQEREWTEKSINGKKTPVRLIKKADLVEVSLVPIPANDQAAVTAVKTGENIAEEILEAAAQEEEVLVVQLEGPDAERFAAEVLDEEQLQDHYFYEEDPATIEKFIDHLTEYVHDYEVNVQLIRQEEE